jgi:hypothetical protein
MEAVRESTDGAIEPESESESLFEHVAFNRTGVFNGVLMPSEHRDGKGSGLAGRCIASRRFLASRKGNR